MNTKTVKAIITIVITATLFTLVNAQPKIKFGKIDINDLKMSEYERDTTADAVILNDYGYAYFTWSDQFGFQIVYEKHVRIKIFNKNAYDWADHTEFLYKSDNNSAKQVLYGLKGYTYNLVDGKVIKTKLSKDAVFKEEYSKNRDKYTFTMPDVREGSILEYKYSIKSDYLFYFPEFTIQYSIPVIWSKYQAKMPEYFVYNPISYGYESISSDRTREAGSISFTMKDRSGGQTSFEQQKIDFTNNVFMFTADHMPSFKSEPYITSKKNYMNRIEFELASIDYPWEIRRDYSKTWKSLNNKLIEHEDFGIHLNKGFFLKDKVSELISGISTTEDKIIALHSYIKDYMKWNERHSIYVNSSLRSAYDKRTGNTADINFLLLVMLKHAGLNANPVILSTRANGLLHPTYPSLTRFNYVIVQVKEGKKTYLLDATDPDCPYYLLPKKCINNKGRLISKGYTEWVPLTSNLSFDESFLCNLTLDEDGIFTGAMENKNKKYAALKVRNAINSETSEDDFIKKIEENNVGLDIQEFEVANLDSIYKPLNINCKVSIEDKADALGDRIYFNPMLYDQIENNPFKLEERKYPVDYAYPLNMNVINRITIPDNYEVEEIPKSISFALPDNTGKFIYRISADGNVIQVTSKFQINKSIFVMHEYPALKQFYDEVVKKHAEQVVLKKKM